MKIGNNIKKIRLWKSIPQKQISDKAGISQATLSKIESGNDFLWSKLIRIAEAMDVSVEELVLLDTSQQPNKPTFNLSGEKAKGMVINQGNLNDNAMTEIIQVLREENLFLRKMLEKSIGNKLTIKKKQYGKLQSKIQSKQHNKLNYPSATRRNRK